MKQTPTFIFDLDGTLLDTLADLAAATNHALTTYGLPQRTLSEVRQMVGNGVRRLMLRAVHEPLSPDGGKTWVEDPVTANADGSLHPRFDESLPNSSVIMWPIAATIHASIPALSPCSPGCNAADAVWLW